MGVRYEFACPTCRYVAEVSGGEDVGMAVETTTIVCLDCRKLRDVVTGQPGQPQQVPRCPRDRHHRWQLWTAGDPCPRCATPIEQGQATLFWD